MRHEKTRLGTTLRWAGIAAGGFALWAATPSQGHAYCTFGSGYANGWNGNAIPVYIRSGAAGDFRHANGWTWSQGEFHSEVQWVLHTMNGLLASNMPPLYYAGTVSCSDSNGDGQYWECAQPNGIVITSTAGSTCGAWMAGSPGSGVMIHLENSASCPARFDQWITPGTRSDLLTSMLHHELGHAIGLDHPGACTSSSDPACTSAIGWCATMGCPWGGDLECPDYYLDDIRGAKSLYGNYAATTVAQRESGDGLTWSSLPVPSVVQQMQWGAAASNHTSNDMYLVSPDPTQRVSALAWDWPSLAWTSLSRASSFYHVGAVGAARDPTQRWAFFSGGESQSWIDDVQGHSRRTDTGSATPYLQWTNSNRRQGVDGTWDPKSNRRVQAYLNNNHEIVLQTVDAGGSTWGTPVTLQLGGQPVVSFAAPSITCGPSDIGRNCMLMWVEAQPASTHSARWAQFNVTGQSSFSFGSMVDTGYTMLERPQVAFAGTNASGSFVMAFSTVAVGGTQRTVITMRKGTQEYHHFGGNRTHSVPSYGDLNYALGSANGTVELLMSARQP